MQHRLLPYSLFKSSVIRWLLTSVAIFSFMFLSNVARAEGGPLQVLSGVTGMPIKGPWDAAGSIAAIQKMYQTMVIQLQELKAQSKFLSDVNQVAKESLRQYDAVNNVSLAQIKKRLDEDKESLTLLDNLNGKNKREKLETLSKELDRRISDPNISDREKKQLQDQLALTQSLKRLQDLEDAL